MSKLKQKCINDYYPKIKRSIDDRKFMIEHKRVKRKKDDDAEDCIVIDPEVNNFLEINLDNSDIKIYKQKSKTLSATVATNESLEPGNARNSGIVDVNADDRNLSDDEVTIIENEGVTKHKIEEDTTPSEDTYVDWFNEEFEIPYEMLQANDGNNNSGTLQQNKRTIPDNHIPMRSSGHSSSNQHFNNANGTLIKEQSLPKQSPKVLFGKSPTKYNYISDIIYETIKNLNYARVGAIPPNNFDLCKIYSKTEYKYAYSNNRKASISTKYEVHNVKSGNDWKSNVLLFAICTALANPINCGYFDEDEFDFIYQILTLKEDALILLARLLRRQRGWFKENDIKYPEVQDQNDAMEVLVSKQICSKIDITNNLSEMLNLLNVEEIKILCNQMNLKNNGKKEEKIQALLRLSKQKPPCSTRSPESCLRVMVFRTLGYCIRVSEKMWSVIDRIMTLLLPICDPTYSDIRDKFYTLDDVYDNKVKNTKTYPENPGNYFPVFANKSHLMKYTEATSELCNVMKLIEKKQWEELKNCGISALRNLPYVLNDESLSFQLPEHVQHYMPGYIWLKILHKCVQAFKKSKDKELAVRALEFLLEHKDYMHTRTGKWYNELLLIKMNYYKKDIENTASIAKQALLEKGMTDVDKLDLWERANNICKKKTGGVASATKADLMNVLSDNKHCIPKCHPATTEVPAFLMPGNGKGKSTWLIKRDDSGESYGSVETVALKHYRGEGFPSAMHCEGSLPIRLFFTLFWEELYVKNISGVFVTPYQEAPSDLYTGQFYKNRKSLIDTKMQKIADNYTIEQFSTWMEDRFEKYQQYNCMIQPVPSNFKMGEIVCCLGVKGVLGICKRLCENFKVWKAGFPDLFLWNNHTKEHKIVEVKGPGDSLSTKQRLWLNYLQGLGLNTEVCLVTAIS